MRSDLVSASKAVSLMKLDFTPQVLERERSYSRTVAVGPIFGTMQLQMFYSELDVVTALPRATLIGTCPTSETIHHRAFVTPTISTSLPIAEMRSLYHALGLLATTLLSLTTATPLAKSPTSTLPLAVTELRYFGDKTWAENIAVRSNGQLIVTRLDTPVLQLLDPTNKTAPITLHTFNTTTYIGRKHNRFFGFTLPGIQLCLDIYPSRHLDFLIQPFPTSFPLKVFLNRQLLTLDDAVLGITEITPNSDIFYVALQTPYTALFTKATNYSNAIFKVNLNTFSSKAGTLTSAPTVSHIIDIPDSIFLNGMDTLDPSHILVADSTLGQIYNIDISTPTPSYTTPLKLSSMAIPPKETPLGVNGIHYRSPYLYFTNLGASTLNRVPIAPITALPTSDSVILVNVTNPDDFAIRDDGTIFICGNGQDTLFMWKEGMNEVVAVAGSNTSTVLAGVTAGAFERARGREGKRLWLTTSGGEFPLTLLKVMGLSGWIHEC
ncbi:hypothetical protein NHQ30_009022 [Ciborinia camelliae]|nr:hypothetical protein NHQ30_009022 [Ciborinia camelliae]